MKNIMMCYRNIQGRVFFWLGLFLPLSTQASLFKPPDDYDTEDLIDLGRQAVTDYGDIAITTLAIGVLVAVAVWMINAFHRASSEPSGSYAKAIGVSMMALIVGVISIAVLFYASNILTDWGG